MTTSYTEIVTETTHDNNTIVTKQRVVSTALGKNITKDHTIIYDEIEKRFGTRYVAKIE